MFHWIKDCPDKAKYEKANVTEDFASDMLEICNITLFNKVEKVNEDHESVFVLEARGAAVIDTACTRTVCGEKWLNDYMQMLKDEDKNDLRITIRDSKVGFKFGDGKTVNLFQRVEIPVDIAGMNCRIETEVVPANIPLLLSKISLKRANTLLNLNNDSAIMFNKTVQLQSTSSGHYCINLIPHHDNTKDECVVLATLEDKMLKEQRLKTFIKLHKQFGHPSTERLLSLLSSAVEKDKDMQQKL